MRKKVGIPRALFYYRYFPLWRTFFEELGAEIVVSEPTNRNILDTGVKNCVDEACMPVKLYHGHVINLRDKADYLFIPRLTSVSKNEYICPKFGGLPDLVRHSIRDLPSLITPEINMRKSARNLWKAIEEAGLNFTKSRALMCKALDNAILSQKQYEAGLRTGIEPCTLLESRDYSLEGKCSQKGKEQHQWENSYTNKESKHAARLNVAVIGHPYLLYDKSVNMNMLEKLKNRGADIITPDMVDEAAINTYASCFSKPVFWNCARISIGSAFYAINECNIDGMVYVMSFGCGIDSFICDLIERRIRRNTNIPFIIITLDEHSGEAGINTRLEAFIDMILWRRSNENNVPSFG